MATEKLTNFDFLNGVNHPAGDEPPSDDWWFTNDSTLADYFQVGTLPDHPEGVGSFIFNRIGHDNVGIDLAGGTNGVALRGLLRADVIHKGLFTNYQDHRGRIHERPNGLVNNEHNLSQEGIDHIEGDIISPDTWQRIIDWQQQNAPDGAGVVLWRPDGALQNLPPSFYHGAAHVVLDMIRPGGVLFTQIPTSLRHDWSHRYDLSAIDQDRGVIAEQLLEVCTSITDREDVDEVIVSEGVSRKGHCALITKSIA